MFLHNASLGKITTTVLLSLSQQYYVSLDSVVDDPEKLEEINFSKMSMVHTVHTMQAKQKHACYNHILDELQHFFFISLLRLNAWETNQLLRSKLASFNHSQWCDLCYRLNISRLESRKCDHVLREPGKKNYNRLLPIGTHQSWKTWF